MTVKIRVNLNNVVELETTYTSLEEAITSAEKLKELIKVIYESVLEIAPKAKEIKLTKEAAAKEVRAEEYSLEGVIEFAEDNFPHLILGKGEVSIREAVLLILLAAKTRGIRSMAIKEIDKAIPWRVPYRTLAPTISKLKAKGFLVYIPTPKGKGGYAISSKGIAEATKILEKLRKKREIK